MRKQANQLMISICLIAAYLLSAHSAVAQEAPHRTLYLGVNIGQGIEAPNIDSTESSGDVYFGFTQAFQPSFHLGVFVEKQLNDLIHLAVGAEGSISSFGAANDYPAKSSSVLLGAGATIGRIHQRNSWFFSFLVGPSRVKIGDSGNPDVVCFFVCLYENPLVRGAESEGIGFRIAVGRTINERIRISLSHKRVGGDATDLADGSTAIMSYTGASLTAACR